MTAQVPKTFSKQGLEGTLSNDDGDGDENGKNAMGLW